MREDLGTTKYLIHAKVEANGVVERPDVVGAIFGQTEGLLGDELDLRELQKTGRIGRIKVDMTSEHGKSTGTIVIPSSLDKVETSIIAAALETVERIGPCEATIKVERIEDVRGEKRKFIVERAKEILSEVEKAAPGTQEIFEQVKGAIKEEEICEYQGLPAGPGVRDSDAIVIVEGRADVLNMLRCGIRNVIAIEGTSVPKPAIELTENKTTTAFLDGDRGGDLILKELLQVAKLDYVARAPQGKSVEELTRNEIIKALRDKVPVDQVLAELRTVQEVRAREPSAELGKLEAVARELGGTLKARLLNEEFETVEEMQVRELREKLPQLTGVTAVVFDGVVTQELADIAAAKGVRYLVGIRTWIERMPAGVRVLGIDDLRRRPRIKTRGS